MTNGLGAGLQSNTDANSSEHDRRMYGLQIVHKVVYLNWAGVHSPWSERIDTIIEIICTININLLIYDDLTNSHRVKINKPISVITSFFSVV